MNKGKARKAYKLTPKGKKVLDALLQFVEDNPDLVAQGFDELVEDMQSSEKTEEAKVE